MKNTIVFDIRTEYKLQFVGSTADDTNRFFITVLADLEQSPILVVGSTSLTITSSPFTYEVSSADWVGSGDLLVTVASTGGVNQTVTITKALNDTDDQMIVKDTDITLHFSKAVDETEDLMYIQYFLGAPNAPGTTDAAEYDYTITPRYEGGTVIIQMRVGATQKSSGQGSNILRFRPFNSSSWFTNYNSYSARAAMYVCVGVSKSMTARCYVRPSQVGTTNSKIKQLSVTHLARKVDTTSVMGSQTITEQFGYPMAYRVWT